jgi:hypothetical protein
LRSLDFTKVPWKNYPATWKIQFQSQEKFAGISIEAVLDHNLWFWHAAFGFPGILNDIDIWERSSLLKSVVNA